mmetsp:Transcript_21530/g.73797  ORF Transcript_21530/g.73797 Transcript_21530/m.73797 type:complete len:222 (+) Transcript_21530:997-1662(+)
MEAIRGESVGRSKWVTPFCRSQAFQYAGVVAKSRIAPDAGSRTFSGNGTFNCVPSRRTRRHLKESSGAYCRKSTKSTWYVLSPVTTATIESPARSASSIFHCVAGEYALHSAAAPAPGPASHCQQTRKRRTNLRRLAVPGTGTDARPIPRSTTSPPSSSTGTAPPSASAACSAALCAGERRFHSKHPSLSGGPKESQMGTASSHSTARLAFDRACLTASGA